MVLTVEMEQSELLICFEMDALLDFIVLRELLIQSLVQLALIVNPQAKMN